MSGNKVDHEHDQGNKNNKNSLSFAEEQPNSRENSFSQKSKHGSPHVGEHEKRGSAHHAHPVAHAHHGYNPLKIPADWEFAKRHAKARQTAPEKQEPAEPEYKQFKQDEDLKHKDEVQAEIPICQCCGYEIERDLIGVTCDLDKLYFLGAGFPMFYNFIKYCILLLTTLFLVEGLPNAIDNYHGTHCQYTEEQVADIEKKHQKMQEKQKKQGKPSTGLYIRPCAYNWVVIFSIANKLNDPSCLSFKVYFSLAVQICLIIELIIFRKTQRQINDTVDSEQTTPSDYSILVQNIPQGLDINYIQKIKDIISTQSVPDKTLSIEKVFLIYDIQELQEKEKELGDIIKQKQKYIDDVYMNIEFDPKDHKIHEFDEEIEKMEEEITHKCNEIKQNEQKFFTGSAIISFSTEGDKQSCIEANQMNFTENFNRLRAYFNGGRFPKQPHPTVYWQDHGHLYIEEAPEPNDLNWEFLHCTTAQKVKARLICFLRQTLLQIICTGTIYGISAAQSYLIDTAYEKMEAHEPGAEEQYGNIKILSIVLSIMIVIFNKFGLGILVHHIADAELWSTQTKLNISFAQMLSIILFSNTALITFLVEIITFKNYYGAGGMIYTEYIVFIFNAFIPPLAWFVDPWSIIKRYKRNKELKKKTSSCTQQQANIHMEEDGYTMGKRYADIMKTMWFTFFYCPVIPLGSFWSIIGLICYYWIDKYNLINRRTIKESISQELTFEMIEFLELIIIFHAFGDFFFKYQLFQYVDKSSIIVLFFGVLYNLLPLQKFNEWLFPMKSEDEETDYNTAKLDFDTDYDRENPVTQHSALKEWLSLKQTSNLGSNNIKSNQSNNDSQIQKKLPHLLDQENQHHQQSNSKHE